MSEQTMSKDLLFVKKDETGSTEIAYSSVGSQDPFPNVPLPSIYRKESFVRQFMTSRGPPQILAVAVFQTMSFGALLGIIPSLMTQRFAEQNYGYEGQDCHSFVNYAQKPQECIDGSADAQNAAAVSELIANILTLITSCALGTITDMYGRKELLVVGVCFWAIAPFSLLYVQVVPDASPFAYYYCRALHGVVNWIAICLSSLSDVLPPQLRAPGVGLYQAGFWGGLCIAPIIATFMNPHHVIVMSCLIQIVGLLFTVFMVPETLSPLAAEEAQRRRQTTFAGQTLIERVCWALAMPFRELSIINRNSFFRLLSMLAFFNGMVTAGDKTLLLYYVDIKLSFNAKDVAILFLCVGVFSTFALGVLLRPLNECIGERLIVVVCFAASFIANLMYAFARNKGTLYAGISLASLTGMAFPTIAAIKANNVDESEQGRIQGALYSIQAVAAGVGPMMMRFVDRSVHNDYLGPGTMFIFAAFLQLFAFYSSLKLPKDKTDSKESNKPDEISGDTELETL